MPCKSFTVKDVLEGLSQENFNSDVHLSEPSDTSTLHLNRTQQERNEQVMSLLQISVQASAIVYDL